MTPDRSAVTAWLLALLRADPEAYPVGDNSAPEIEVDAYPYLTIWSIPGGSQGGPPLGASKADAVYVYQIDSVGKVRQQAEALGSRINGRVVGRAADGSYAAPSPVLTGMVVLDRDTADTPGGATSEGTHPNEVWTYSERFAISVSAQT